MSGVNFRRPTICGFGVILLAAHIFIAVLPHARADALVDAWNNPPQDARLRAYWWWINGNVTKEAITRDLEQMKAIGFGGALICDADGSSQDGNDRAPHGPTFFSPEWRELYKHTLREADRLGLEMSLNIQSGWNLGGPMVPAEDAPKKLVWTETRLSGGTNFIGKLEQARGRDGYYRDLFVLAYRVNPSLPPERKPIQNQKQKALLDVLRPFSAPNSAPLFAEIPATPNEQDALVTDVVDVTKHFSPDGTLRWKVPAGAWVIIRMGCTLNDHARVSTCSEGWDGYALDPFDAGAFKRYWDTVVEPLIADAGPHAGKALKYLHTDSWEVEVANWTPTLVAEFKKRRGYDLLPWLPVIAGKIVNSREESNRFLHDFRRTMGDLAMDNHFKLFKEWSHKRGLLIHPESGGPHAVPIDAQQALGFNDAPMSEFWAWSWRHRMGDENRFFVKQPASAAHTYGKKLVLAEGFTTIGPHWQETIWDNLKPSFDFACTEGMNLLVWHAFVCSPASEGIPGQQYFAGTHLNPNVTWWEKSKPFFDYINRCQALLQQGLPVADVAYYYGSHVPNFTQLRSSDPAKVGAGFDYDVVTEEVILTRMSVKDGKLVLPDGVSYRMLVLPERDIISLPVLRKLKELVGAGATIIGPQPTRSMSLENYPKQDAEVQKLARELWGKKSAKGRVIADKPAREVLLADGVKPDFAPVSPVLNYIHRRAGEAEIYFVASRTNVATSAECAFRVTGKAPELWNAVTGERRFAAAYAERDGQTIVPLEFDPYGSWFVVFRETAAKHQSIAKSNGASLTALSEITGAWTVRFDTNWAGPAEVQFDSLVSWPTRDEPGIKFFSGTATYEKPFSVAESAIGNRQSAIYLDLGNVRELAEVKVNGKSCGITWAPPFRVDITAAVRAGENKLEVEVVNFWPNRIIGDAALPKEQRLTRTNIRKLTRDTKLMESGLLGPVRLLHKAVIPN
ncbi:MAG: glycosyl hydrolase [Verrucomicrobiota bacterium]